MKTLSIFTALAFSLGACTYSSSPANAQQSDASTLASGQPLVVAELFTSQSCSSCPPAELMFSKLAERDDLITIEWHVDYWDTLVHRGSRWKDPYSDKTFTARQRSYNRSLRGKPAVYTPQAIVNGRLEGVGSRSNDVSDMLKNVPALSVPVSIADNIITVGPSPEGADILFVRLLERHETDVKGGENKGKELHGRNIVLDAVILGKAGKTTMDLSLPPLKDGESCAILVQTLGDIVGPVRGAAKCA